MGERKNSASGRSRRRHHLMVITDTNFADDNAITTEEIH